MIDVAPAIALTQPIELNFVTVREPGRDADSVLRHVEAMAMKLGVRASTTVCDDGHPPSMRCSTSPPAEGRISS